MTNIIKTERNIEIEDVHKVRLIVKDSFFHDTLSLYVDGVLKVQQDIGFGKLNGQVVFEIEGRKFMLKYLWRGAINGHPVSVVLERNNKTLVLYGSDLASKVVTHIRESEHDYPSRHLPTWAWYFFIANGLLAVVGLCNEFILGISFLGMLGCYLTARDTGRSERTRIWISAGITAAAWLIALMVGGFVYVMFIFALY